VYGLRTAAQRGQARTRTSWKSSGWLDRACGGGRRACAQFRRLVDVGRAAASPCESSTPSAVGEGARTSVASVWSTLAETAPLPQRRADAGAGRSIADVWSSSVSISATTLHCRGVAMVANLLWTKAARSTYPIRDELEGRFPSRRTARGREPLVAAERIGPVARVPSSSTLPLSTDDEALLRALREGDDRVFAQLVERWSGAMLRMALVHLDRRAVAEEVVQEAWLTVLRGLDRFERRSALRTWVLGIVVNLARSRARAERREAPLDCEGGTAAEPARLSTAGRRRMAGSLGDRTRTLADPRAGAVSRRDARGDPARRRQATGGAARGPGAP
jgi:DNA-directed RNA polymerase specialized sigma24 family protein